MAKAEENTVKITEPEAEVETGGGLKFHEDNVPETAPDKHGIERIVSTGVKDNWVHPGSDPDPDQVEAAKLRTDTH